MVTFLIGLKISSFFQHFSELQESLFMRETNFLLSAVRSTEQQSCIRTNGEKKLLHPNLFQTISVTAFANKISTGAV